MYSLRAKCIIAGIVVLILLISVGYNHFVSRQDFISGFWYNDKERFYILIGNKKKNGRYGAYIINDRNAMGELDTNEAIELGIELGLFNNLEMRSFNTKKLPSKMIVDTDMSKGLMKLPINNKKVILYKDTYTSNNI